LVEEGEIETAVWVKIIDGKIVEYIFQDEIGFLMDFE
jgi:hypothetical protein